MQQGSTLNFAAGNMYLVDTNLSKLNIEMMKQQKELQIQAAQGVQSEQVLCLTTEYASARDARSALDQEASGLIAAGGIAIGGAAVSGFALMPAKGVKSLGFGHDASQEELGNLTKFKERLVNHSIITTAPATTTTAAPAATATAPAPATTAAPAATATAPATTAAPAATATAPATAPATTTTTTTATATATLTKINPRNPIIDQWLGQNGAYDVSGYSDSVHKTNVESLTTDEAETVSRHVNTAHRELSEKLYEQINRKLSNLSQFGNTCGQTGNIAQGLKKQEQAQFDAASKQCSAQGQIFAQDESGYASYEGTLQSNGDGFKQESLQILANLNTQG